MRIALLVVLAGALLFGARYLFMERITGPELLELHHRGVMLVEQHNFVAAEEVLAKVVKHAPDDFVPRFNLAMAQLNQAENGVDRALVTLAACREMRPNDPRVAYCLGIIYRFLENEQAALEEYRRAVELAPRSADANYNVAISLSHLDRRDEALPYFEMAARLDPTLLGAWNNLQLLYRRAGRTEDADHALERFQALKNTGEGRAQSTKYTEQGELAATIRDWDLVMSGDLGELAITFAPAVEVAAAGGTLNAAALVDLDLDCKPQLWRVGASAGIWDLTSGSVQSKPVPPAFSAATTFAVGEVNGDGIPDLALARPGAIEIFTLSSADPSSMQSWQVIPVSEPVRTLRFVDLDLEGDLDLLIVPESGEPRLALNEGREFRAPGSPELPELGVSSVELVAAQSIDTDTDADLVFAEVDTSGWGVVRNDPQWAFEPNPDEWDFRTAPGGRALVAEFDGDGLDDVLVASAKDGSLTRWSGKGTTFEKGASALKTSSQAPPIAPPASWLSIVEADFDLDGALDLAAIGRTAEGANALWIFRNAGDGTFEPILTEPTTAAELLAGDLDDDFDPDLILLAEDGSIAWRKNRTDPLQSSEQVHAVRLYFGGVRDNADRRSNLLGYGVRVEVRSGDNTSVRTFVGAPGFRAQGLAPCIVGIGPRDDVSWLYLLWPDGVSQSEFDVPVDSCSTIPQVQRKMSSCPVLFTWDGEEYRFITDFMGGGGLGFWIGPDEYAFPEPTEVVRIEPGALAPIDGEIRVSVMEPMQESCSIDHLDLIAVDHPAGTSVYPNEYFPVRGAPPSGHALQVVDAERVFPSSIRDREGVLDPNLVREVDRRYAGPRSLDPDLVGYAGAQEWVIEFDKWSNLSDDAVRLFLSGWVEYPYSRLNFAAWQRSDKLPRRLEAPTFWWDRGDDDWQLIGREFGYPAGMPKTMVLDVTEAIANGATRFKIASNLELFWDQIFLAATTDVAAEAQSSLALQRAVHRFGGYPREYSDDGALPKTYHYDERDPDLGYQPMGGWFTKYGRVDELLNAVDDQFVVMGGGDEIYLVYQVPDEPAKGSVRTYLLDTHGYCKDRDPLTATPEAVDPLPFATMTAYPPAPTDVEPNRDEYRRKWNTRRDGGDRSVRVLRGKRSASE